MAEKRQALVVREVIEIKPYDDCEATDPQKRRLHKQVISFAAPRCPGGKEKFYAW